MIAAIYARAMTDRVGLFLLATLEPARHEVC
jgi:hypothetical protein